MKDFFKPEDFNYENSRYASAQIANAKLAVEIEKWQPIYTDGNEYVWHFTKLSGCTKQARLAFIEEIPKKECEHTPLVGDQACWDGELDAWYRACRYCNATLIAKWEPTK